MKVTIEEIRKAYDDVHYYRVYDGNQNMKLFSYKDNMHENDIYNKDRAFAEAKEYALRLKESKKDIITLIETL